MNKINNKLYHAYHGSKNSFERFSDNKITITKNELAEYISKYIDPVYIVYSNNQITNRRKIYLNEAYHFGDLDYGKKADQKDIIVGQGRSTGHFGTGFYVVSFYDKSKTPDTYWNRGHWEIDLDKYYLYKPISNNQAHKLHDTLGLLDDLDLDALKNYSPTELLNELWDLEDYYDNKGILMFIKKYCPYIMKTYDFKKDLSNERWGAIEDYAKSYIEDIERANDHLEVILRKLSDIFNLSEKEVKDIINEIIKDDKSNDSLGTRFMKKLGFEGVNVSHLKQDADGLSGLDNFTYGSVVYDLKPGTYRKL